MRLPRLELWPARTRTAAWLLLAALVAITFLPEVYGLLRIWLRR